MSVKKIFRILICICMITVVFIVNCYATGTVDVELSSDENYNDSGVLRRVSGHDTIGFENKGTIAKGEMWAK